MKKGRKQFVSLVLTFFFVIFILGFISPICTVVFDKESYIVGETITATMSCSEATEKSDGYQLNWTFQNGTVVESDSGTTPATVGENFYQNYIIPSSWPNGVFINATLAGVGNTDLEGSDFANVSSTAGANSLIIQNATFSGGYIGLASSVNAIVTDENGKKISGGMCRISAWSNDEQQILLYSGGTPVEGIFLVSDIFPSSRFEENTDYSYKINCYCGSNGSSTECIDEDGVAVTNSAGSLSNFFTTSTWLTVNTVVDDTIYEPKEDIFICANVTNVNYSKRIPLHIFSQVRCSKGVDNSEDTDRILINYNLENDPDLRGISPNTTQMQCKKFILPEEDYLMGSNSECYASTVVWVVDDEHNELIEYSTTSPSFNITSDELNIDVDWQQIGDKSLNAIVNLSDFGDIQGSGTGNIDIRLMDDLNQRISLSNSIELFNLIENITVRNSSIELVEHVDYELEFLDDGELEIEIRNVNLSSGWWNITLDFYDLNLREIEALEGIENKTGTFHLDVECPSQGLIGSDINCSITAQVEDSQMVEKEVDFTCFIDDGANEWSSINFNQMVMRTPITLYRTFAIPSDFINGQSYVLQCYADYYNLGSRRDSFYDTFYASVVSSGEISGGGSARSYSSPITGAVVEDGEEFVDEGIDIGDIIDKFDPFSPERNLVFLFVEMVLFIFIFYFVFSLFLRKKRSLKSKKLEKTFGRLMFFLFVLAGIVLLLWGLVQLYNYFRPELFSVLGDSFLRDLILIGFIVLLGVVIFKALNIRGEIRFGRDYSVRNHYHERKTSKLQERLNQMIIKDEIRRHKEKK